MYHYCCISLSFDTIYTIFIDLADDRKNVTLTLLTDLYAYKYKLSRTYNVYQLKLLFIPSKNKVHEHEFKEDYPSNKSRI